ncbi:MAG: acyl-CoA reductase [Bacteroidota bacterium]|nr:acyl-CoA reductase [Bacteroidota bacterium]
MNYTQRFNVISELGVIFRQSNPDFPLFEQAYLSNNWFTIDMQIKAIKAWGQLLTKENLEKWLADYQFPVQNVPKTVIIIMAGNIPLVGLHDLICVFISGNRALVKPSSDDTILIKWVIDELKKINPLSENLITIAEDYRTNSFDAVIATGSNNSNRYFEYYFKNKPNLLRKSRNSIAVLTGNETAAELDKLADDIFLYFGLGCRNVSKVLLPQGYNLEPMIVAFERYKDIINHNKYANNYTYHKAIFLMNLAPHLDNGFLILKQDDLIASPLSVLLFQFYESLDDVYAFIEAHKNELQCVVGNINGGLAFGQSQSPELWDYADGIDTLKFLEQ